MATLQQVIQVDTKQFKSDADMCSEDEVFKHVNHIEFVFSILISHNLINLIFVYNFCTQKCS